MENVREELNKLLQQLAQQRDELRVKMSLAKLEVREEWERLEGKWEHVRATAPKIREELGTSAANVTTALRQAAEEIRQGYVRLRNRL